MLGLLLRLGSIGRREEGRGQRGGEGRGVLGVPGGLRGFDFLPGSLESERRFYVCHYFCSLRFLIEDRRLGSAIGE